MSHPGQALSSKKRWFALHFGSLDLGSSRFVVDRCKHRHRTEGATGDECNIPAHAHSQLRGHLTPNRTACDQARSPYAEPVGHEPCDQPSRHKQRACNRYEGERGSRSNPISQSVGTEARSQKHHEPTNQSSPCPRQTCSIHLNLCIHGLARWDEVDQSPMYSTVPRTLARVCMFMAP